MRLSERVKSRRRLSFEDEVQVFERLIHGGFDEIPKEHLLLHSRRNTSLQ